MAVERVLSNLNLISFKTEGGLQNHIDELQDGDLVFTPDSSLKGNLFDFKWTDHKLNDISWLNADTFSWQSGDVYVAAYEHLKKDAASGGLYYRWSTRSDAAAGYNRNIKTRTPTVGEKFYTATDEGWVDTGVTVAQIIDENTVVDSEGATLYWLGNMTNLPADRKEETISGTTVTYFQAEDGHKICLPDQESNVQALYEATGVAWYYILDTANKQFKLPRTKFGFTGLRDEVGGYVEAGLPSIEHTHSATIKTVNAWNGTYLTAGANQNGTTAQTFKTDANSAVSKIYGNSDTVQPKATQMYLYFYVGNFEQSALEQTAGITSEQLNNKADVELVNSINSILSAVDSRVSTLESDVRIIGFQLPLSSNAYSFYIKFSNGLVVQGRNTVYASGVWNLPVPMQDANYVVATSYVTSDSTNTPQWKYLGVAKTSTTVTAAQNGLAQSILVLGKAA